MHAHREFVSTITIKHTLFKILPSVYECVYGVKYV